jgi:hypothetical protein
MANEITVVTKLIVVNGNYKEERSVSQYKRDQTTQGGIAQVQDVGTTHELLDVGDVGTEGMVHVRNLDSTNYVEIGVDVAATFYPVIKLSPGDPAVFPAGATLYARANTAAVKLDSMILEA